MPNIGKQMLAGALSADEIWIYLKYVLLGENSKLKSVCIKFFNSFIACHLTFIVHVVSCYEFDRLS